jgi:UDP-glucose 4-epimerase
VVEAALAAGAWKFVYCSTCGVHGNVEHPPANEDAPIQPADY